MIFSSFEAQATFSDHLKGGHFGRHLSTESALGRTSFKKRPDPVQTEKKIDCFLDRDILGFLLGGGGGGGGLLSPARSGIEVKGN